MTVKSCLKSMRLRTLPLSLSGVIVGISLSSKQLVTIPTIVFLVLTTVFLQILSNLSNELGDTLHGTDTADRQGVHYSIQDGEMTIPEMKRLINVMVVLCCLSGLAMIWFSFKGMLVGGKVYSEGNLPDWVQPDGCLPGWVQPLSFVVLGVATIWAAMHYTLGKHPYGYRGLGDVFVFIFFGLVSTLGAAYICSHSFIVWWLLPAGAIGCFSVGVLNVNNIRDMKTDAATRTTIALKMGLHRARIYQTVLILGGWALILAYSLLCDGGCAGAGAPDKTNWLSLIYLITFPLFCLHLRGIWTREDRRLDPMLPLLVMSTFALSILFAIG